MEEETLDKGPKGGGKEELEEEEWVSLNTLSFRKTKIWQDQDMTRLLNFTITQEREEKGFFVYFGMKERGGFI